MQVRVALVCLVLASCAGMTAPTVPLDRNFILAPQDSVAIDDSSMQIRFNGVEGDSRCPADAVCVTGGDALVKIDVIENGGTVTGYALHTGDMRPVTHADLTIALVQLQPYPFSGRTIQQSEYRATLRVTR